MKATTMTLSTKRQSVFPQDWCERVGLAKGGQPYQATGSKLDPVDKPATLAEAGIDKHLAAGPAVMAGSWLHRAARRPVGGRRCAERLTNLPELRPIPTRAVSLACQDRPGAHGRNQARAQRR